MSAPFSFTYSRLTYSSPFHRFVTIKLRPLTGFLIAKLTSHFLIERLPFFIPSPLGASYFQINYKQTQLKNTRRYCFRPLSGHLIFKLVTIEIIIWDGWFPSPLGASYFQISDYRYAYNKLTQQFPSPLGASYFQIWNI